MNECPILITDADIARGWDFVSNVIETTWSHPAFHGAEGPILQTIVSYEYGLMPFHSNCDGWSTDMWHGYVMMAIGESE